MRCQCGCGLRKHLLVTFKESGSPVGQLWLFSRAIGFFWGGGYKSSNSQVQLVSRSVFLPSRLSTAMVAAQPGHLIVPRHLTQCVKPKRGIDLLTSIKSGSTMTGADTVILYYPYR